jgi:hypothetical protein
MLDGEQAKEAPMPGNAALPVATVNDITLAF